MSDQSQIPKIKFKIWKTIKLGTGLDTAYGFERELTIHGFQISNCAYNILGNSAFTVAAKETEIDLVVVLVAELGFKQGAGLEDIYKRAQEFGLKLCPPEVGPQLRLQYADQPMNEWLLVGMEPIAISYGDLLIFDVGRDVDGLWLYGSHVLTGNFWGLGVRLVFTRPRN